MVKTTLIPVGKWGRYPLFQAKVGTMPGCLVLIKRKRSFMSGDMIQYILRQEVEGRRTCCAPSKWHGGMISKIGDNRLFIERM